MYSRLVKGFEPITVTCKGEYDDPLLKVKIGKFKRTLQSLLDTGSRSIAVDDVAPWNSIRIKLRLSHDASLRLRELAQQRNQALADLGILSLHFENDSQPLAIVDVPPTSSGGPGELAGPSSYSASSASANNSQYSYLLGNAPLENKNLTGVRRALPHSSSDLSSSPKIPKRASGIRRPRVSRSARGSRGGSVKQPSSSIGTIVGVSISPKSESTPFGATSGCEHGQNMTTRPSDEGEATNQSSVQLPNCEIHAPETHSVNSSCYQSASNDLPEVAPSAENTPSRQESVSAEISVDSHSRQLLLQPISETTTQPINGCIIASKPYNTHDEDNKEGMHSEISVAVDHSPDVSADYSQKPVVFNGTGAFEHECNQAIHSENGCSSGQDSGQPTPKNQSLSPVNGSHNNNDSVQSSAAPAIS